MFFVFYRDDYDEMGGVGLEEFTAKSDALAFIESRLAAKAQEGGGNLGDYTLIEGTVLPLVAVAHVTKVAAVK